jgi:hypothetical protein
MAAARPRMLAVVARFTWMHIDYLDALGEHFDLRVLWSGEAGRGVAADAARQGLSCIELGEIPSDGVDAVRARLGSAVADWRPDVVLVMFNGHEALTVLAREAVGDSTRIVFQCADPVTAITHAGPGSEPWRLEGEALRTSDVQILVTRAMRRYLERVHDLDLRATSLIQPHGYSRDTVAPPSTKLSARDGRVHIALVGTAHDTVGHHRWYGEIIPGLMSLGLVVHSHFWDLPEFGLTLDPYRALERELEDYHHFEGRLPYRGGDLSLSKVMSRYDLMGVLYHRGPSFDTDVVNLSIHLPAKAVCGWLHGGIPAVCFRWQEGVAEWIEDLGIGFVIDDWDDLRDIAADRDVIAAAGERCLGIRERFTTQHLAAAVRGLVE